MQLGQSNMHSTLDFCARPARKETNGIERAISAFALASTVVGAALEPNAIILNLGLYTARQFNPIS